MGPGQSWHWAFKASFLLVVGIVAPGIFDGFMEQIREAYHRFRMKQPMQRLGVFAMTSSGLIA
jgi:hypothetical protein